MEIHTYIGVYVWGGAKKATYIDSATSSARQYHKRFKVLILDREREETQSSSGGTTHLIKRPGSVLFLGKIYVCYKALRNMATGGGGEEVSSSSSAVCGRFSQVVVLVALSVALGSVAVLALAVVAVAVLALHAAVAVLLA